MNKEQFKAMFKELVDNGEINFNIGASFDHDCNSVDVEISIEVDGVRVFSDSSYAYLPNFND